MTGDDWDFVWLLDFQEFVQDTRFELSLVWRYGFVG
jgi:hypothetical protein